MAQYKFKQEITATGSNIVPAGSKMMSFQVKRVFKKGEIVDGDMPVGGTNVKIKVDGGTKQDGSTYTGNTQFSIPISMVESNVDSGTPATTTTSTEKPTYIFTKPFSKVVTVGGVVGIRTFSYKVGDKIQGTEYPEGQSLSVMPSPNVYLSIPYEYIQKEGASADVSDTTKNETASKSVFTTKNVVIGLAAFVGLVGLLKITKII